MPWTHIIVQDCEECFAPLQSQLCPLGHWSWGHCSFLLKFEAISFFTEGEMFFFLIYISVNWEQDFIWYLQLSNSVLHIPVEHLWEYGGGLNVALNTWSFNKDLNYKSL